jgi:hypothetical protein
MLIMRTILKKTLQGCIELILFFPVLLAIGLYLTDSRGLWLWLFSMTWYYLFGVSLQALFRWRQRHIQLGVALIVAGWIAFLVVEGTYAAVISAVIGMFLFHRGVKMVDHSWEDMFPLPMFWVGLIVYLFSYFFYKHNTAASEYLSHFTWFGIASLILCLYFTNLWHLKAAALSGPKTPSLSSSLVRQNRIMVFLLSGFILFVGAFDAIKDMIVRWIKRFFAWLFAMLADEGPEEPLPNETIDTGLPQLPQSEGEPSWFMMLLEKIALIVFTILTIAAVIWLAYVAFTRLIGVLKKFARWLTAALFHRANIPAEQTGYTDEKSNVLSWKDLPKTYARQAKDWLTALLAAERKWSELTNNRERARYLYRHFLYRMIAAGYPISRALTPREIGKDINHWRETSPQDADHLNHFIELYNAARFGNSEIDNTDIDKMKKLDEALKTAMQKKK